MNGQVQAMTAAMTPRGETDRRATAAAGALSRGWRGLVPALAGVALLAGCAVTPAGAPLPVLAGLTAAPLVHGTARFDPSGPQTPTVGCGNPVSTVIRASAMAGA
ncbi:hypothetical protein IX55_16010, partial [Paracoccus sanguinis]